MKKKIWMAGILATGIVLAGCGAKTDEAPAAVEEQQVEETADAVVEETAEETAEEVVEETGDVTVSTEGVVPGVYQNRFVDEIEGDKIAIYTYVVLKEDGTGLMEIQDSIPITWDDAAIKDASNTYSYTVDGKTITVDGIEYKLLENTTVEEFMEYHDNPEFRFSIEDANYIPNSFVEIQADKFSFESYDELISYLLPEQAYAYIKIAGYEGDVLAITEYTYEYEEGKHMAIDATLYAKIGDTVKHVGGAYSDGTARPVAVKDGIIMGALQHGVDGEFFTEDGTAIMAKFDAYEEFDEDGNSTYDGFYRESNSFDPDVEKRITTQEEFQELYDYYLSADPIEFTVVE